MDTYEFITAKINQLKEKYPSLRARTDDYVFSVLCFKNYFYKNPALLLNEDDFAEIVVDSSHDGGVDILLSDPNSETSDLVIGQSKFYKTISKETVLNAVRKMADFYKDMTAGHFEQFNSHVKSRFLTLDAEVGEESKIHFIFYTSAPKKESIDTTYIERKFRELFADSSSIEISILFADDIAEEIRDSESRRQTVERGKIRIDEANNYLLYGDDAAIVNVSARSIAYLYTNHNTHLLELNLRHYIKGKGKSEQKVDNAINSTIKNNPESFWLKNNGITITCDNFRISGREVHLENFSIVNGGQTTYLLNKNKKLIDAHDFYLPCKIIKNVGNTEQERIQFSSKIAEAANSQKPIKPADLLANAPEQLRFAKAMLAVDLFYQTKRGEEIPPKYHRAYLHTKLEEVGKLCLAAIFQEPCKSRNNPSVAYKHIDEGDKNPYYKTIFNGNQFQVAQICKELLYIDSYFPTFRKKFDSDNESKPNAEYRKDFAHIARRTCVAFVALAARVHQDNLTDENIATLTSEKSDKKVLYEMLRNLGDMKFLLPIKLYTDDYKAALDKLFTLFIQNGVRVYKLSKIPATNFFKAEQNYYDILSDDWEELKSKINKIFAGI